mmetsp:Transcript_19950/g.29320  ORF Transcript_19950/g.29320 Transcript_19950/m.29320 type:complete len:789 (+) Transcript_19950:97-2463(+)
MTDSTVESKLPVVPSSPVKKGKQVPSVVPATPKRSDSMSSSDESSDKVTGLKETKKVRFHNATASPLRDSLMELQSLKRVTSHSFYEVEWKQRLMGPFRTLVGIVALIECLGYVVPLAISSWDAYNAEEEEEEEEQGGLLFKLTRLLPRKEEIVVMEEAELEWWRTLSEWLSYNKYYFGFVLSVLWFLDAFLLADTWREKVRSDWDRDWFLSQYDINGNKKESDKPRECPHGGTVAYATRLIAHWSILPASFFLLFAADSSHLFHLIFGSDDSAASQNLTNTTATEIESEFEFHSETNMQQLDEAYTTTSIRYSIFYMIIVHIGNSIKTLLKILFKKQMDTVIKPKIKKYAVRVTRFAVLNPIVFKRRLNKLRDFLRWAKYLAPIIGTANKLKGNTVDLLKKWRQRREALIAQRIRQQIFRQLSEEEQMEKSAIMMQKKFRAWQVRKATRAMMILEGKKEVFAAMKMQSRFRGLLARARKRIQEKKERLERLRVKDLKNRDPRTAMLNRTKSKIMTDDDRRQMYLLEQDLEMEMQKRSKRTMLMRPNTRFAVIWKCLFVFCISLEISQKVFDPVLAKYKDTRTGERLNFEGVLNSAFVPTPIEMRPKCYHQKNIPLHGQKNKSPKTDGTTNAAESTTTATTTHSRKMKKKAPWYCHNPYASTLTTYINALRFLIHNFLVLVSCICFLDVFVTFFTGELNEDTGVLVPKAFFTRWILPGVVLQMLVNPMMGQVFVALKAVMRWAHVVGPGRCWRWCVSFISPALGYAWYLFEWNVWRRLVKSENKHTYK